MYELFQHFFISLLRTFSDGDPFCTENRIPDTKFPVLFAGTTWLCGIRFVSPQLKQTHNNKHVLMPVLNLDRVLLANSGTCHLVSSKPQISSCFFKNNTCFTFNTKFVISLHIIRILAAGFLKNYSCLTLKTIHYSI